MSGARVWVIGSGAREHALAWKLSKSPQVVSIGVVPGNDGMSPEWDRIPAKLAEGKVEFERLARVAREQSVSLVVVGPDQPLADGLVDCFEAQGLSCFGPSREASKLEWSKAFSKEVMQAAQVPTARFWAFENASEAKRLLKSVPWGARGWVIKADGLALGKGVRVCRELSEAESAASEFLALSGKIIVEEEVRGQESSWFAFCEGERCVLLDAARDYKQLKDQGQGPNTGGMGAYSPLSEFDARFAQRVREEVFLPVLREMVKRGSPYRGILYAGLMVDSTSGQYWVLEFNARFGDPEAQVLLARMEDDFFGWAAAVAQRKLAERPSEVRFTPEAAVYVVAASAGYPESPQLGASLPWNLAQVPEHPPHLFFAGVRREDPSPSARLQCSGGRVLGVMGRGADLKQARSQAYARLERIRFEGMQFRKDIGEARS